MNPSELHTTHILGNFSKEAACGKAHQNCSVKPVHNYSPYAPASKKFKLGLYAPEPHLGCKTRRIVGCHGSIWTRTNAKSHLVLRHGKSSELADFILQEQH